MTALKRLAAVSDLLLCFVRKWWRPAICWGIAVILHLVACILVVNGIYLPLKTGLALDWSGFAQALAALAALIGSVTPFAWLRTKEKIAATQD
jgi:hypothetical protein